MSKTRPGRAPPLPRGRWCAPDRRLSSGRHLPLSSGQSLRPRLNIPSAGVTFTRRHQGFTHVRPSPHTAGRRVGSGSSSASRRSSPRPQPPDGTGTASASTPGFAPRGYPRRTPRRRQAIAHWPEYYTFDISRTSKRCLLLHSCTLTSHVVAGRFHHHARDPLTGQVLTQRQDLRRHRRPRRDCLDRLASTCPSHADADLGVLLRDVRPSPLLLPPSDPTFQSARRGEDRDFQHPADTHSPQPPARPNLRAPRCAPKAAPICSTEDTRAWQRRYPYHDRIQPLSIEQWGCRTPATTTG